MIKELFKQVDTRKLVMTNTKNMIQIVGAMLLLICGLLYNANKINSMQEQLDNIENKIVLVQKQETPND